MESESMAQSSLGLGPTASSDLKLKEDLHMIIDGLYLGSFEAVLNTERLRRLNISHILVLAYPSLSDFEPDFRYMCIELIDDYKSNLFKSLSDGIMFI